LAALCRDAATFLPDEGTFVILIRMNRRFDHEKLEVYQAALAFVAWLEPALQKLPKTIAVREHLDRASTSIVLNPDLLT
jgi:hypothetical protein